jgi:hypothetical protein
VTGRPSKFTPALAERILAGLAEGRSLRAVAAEPGMPGRATILRWVATDRDFRDQYARAREICLECWADDIVGIADAVEADLVAIARARLQIDARKWMLARLLPRKYGDRVQQDTTVNAGDGLAELLARAALQPVNPKAVPVE